MNIISIYRISATDPTKELSLHVTISPTYELLGNVQKAIRNVRRAALGWAENLGDGMAKIKEQFQPLLKADSVEAILDICRSTSDMYADEDRNGASNCPQEFLVFVDECSSFDYYYFLEIQQMCFGRSIEFIVFEH